MDVAIVVFTCNACGSGSWAVFAIMCITTLVTLVYQVTVTYPNNINNTSYITTLNHLVYSLSYYGGGGVCVFIRLFGVCCNRIVRSITSSYATFTTQYYYYHYDATLTLARKFAAAAAVRLGGGGCGGAWRRA